MITITSWADVVATAAKYTDPLTGVVVKVGPAAGFGPNRDYMTILGDIRRITGDEIRITGPILQNTATS